MIQRRRFFRQLVSEGLSFVDTLAGVPQFRLADLGTLPDQVLFGLRPTLCAGVSIVVDGDRVCARSRDWVIELYPAQHPAATLLEHFNGRTTLADIADAAAPMLEIEPSQARAIAKDALIRLTALGVCIPANPLDGGGAC
jgi:hypothetical protein